jgi:hypothetical protein
MSMGGFLDFFVQLLLCPFLFWLCFVMLWHKSAMWENVSQIGLEHIYKVSEKTVCCFSNFLLQFASGALHPSEAIQSFCYSGNHCQ